VLAVATGACLLAASPSLAVAHTYPGDSNHMGDRILKPGMNGQDVRVLQDYLTRAGFPTTVTGYFGSSTKKNVVAFERAHHLQANGLVTWNVNQALRTAAAGKSSDPPQKSADSSGGSTPSGAGMPTTPTVPTGKATISHGLAIAPADAPEVVKNVIAAANQIASKPYVYGGGHGSWNSSGYDCSGSVSYALHGGGMLNSPEDSGTLESYGSAGAGQWITIYANAGHAYMIVAGLRFDTSAQSQTGGSRWTSQGRSSSGFVVRHPAGY
jgi:peptidoglycan hydrolase-like protein with peptidoglycan-binding domain